MFDILKKDSQSRARLGILKTAHGDVQTPAYVIVGTYASVRCLDTLNENKTGKFNKESLPIVKLNPEVSKVIGDNTIHISEFVIAKVKGLVKGFLGHSEITDDVLKNLPENLSNPYKIYKDLRSNKKYLFINLDPTHAAVVEVLRSETGKTEVNTIYPLGEKTLKQLEKNNSLQAVYSRSAGGTATSPSSFSQQGLSGVSESIEGSVAQPQEKSTTPALDELATKTREEKVAEAAKSFEQEQTAKSSGRAIYGIQERISTRVFCQRKDCPR